MFIDGGGLGLGAVRKGDEDSEAGKVARVDGRRLFVIMVRACNAEFPAGFLSDSVRADG